MAQAPRSKVPPAPPPPPLPSHCSLWLPKRHRYCQSPPLSVDVHFCGMHAPGVDREKCPHCQCMVAKLIMHTRKCPNLLLKLRDAKQPFFVARY